MSTEFRILGPLEVVRDGQQVELGGRKPRAVLAVLLLNANEVVSTDRLIEALWRDAPPASAPKALQVHVSQLRKALGAEADDGELLVTRSPGYVLELDPDQLDLTRFDRLASEGRAALASGDPEPAARSLHEALSLWRGPPLADLGYEPFAQTEIARLADVRVAALEDRLEADLACGRHGEVIGELEALVAAEPLRERPWGQLMLALYRAGRQSDALDAFRRAREVLVEELGIEPGKELRRLHEAVLAQDRGLDLARRTAADVRPAEAAAAEGDSKGEEIEGGDADFVGRERELDELETALGRALEGNGSAYLLGGEPGIGKSRLADELSRRARDRGARVLWGRCWEAGGAPAYWPWVQALRAHVAESADEVLRNQLGPRGSEVTQVLPELRDRFPDLPTPSSPESEGARFRLFEAAAEFVKRAGEDVPLMLVLDDLHAADTPSLLMLGFVAGEIASAPVLIVGTYRDVEVTPGHPLDHALDDIARQQTGHVVRLEGLDEAGVSRLIESRARRAPSRRTVAAIHRGTAGNPLFVGELVQLLVAENRLEEAADQTGVRLGVTRGVHEVIGRRLERVPDECRRTLGVGAVLGRDFDLAGLAEVTQRDAGELLDVLDQPVSQGIVGEVAGLPDRFRFSHGLIRDVLYEELGASRRRRLHHRAGEAIESLYSGDLDPHLAELAHHFFEAGPTGDPEKALAYARRAGERAAAQLAYEEAARHYELGIRVLRSAGRTDEETRCELMLALADARMRGGDEEGAKAKFLQAAEIARKLGDAEAIARAALGYGGLVLWLAARGDRNLIPLLEEALEALSTSDSPLRARVLARLSGAIRDQDDRDRRRPLSEEAVEMARRLGDRRTLAYALDARCLAMVDPESMERFTDTAREVIDVAEEIGEAERAFTGSIYLFCSLLQVGDVDGAKRVLRSMPRHGEEQREPTFGWGLTCMEAALALFEGRFEEAEELSTRAYKAGQHAIAFSAVAARALQRFLLHRERGGLADWEPELRECATTWPGYHSLRSALANLYVELGSTDSARDVLDNLADNAFEDVYYDEEFLASMTLIAEVCVALGDLDRATLVYERLLPHRHRNAFAMIEFSLGSVARPLGLLAASLGHTEEAIDHLERASAMNDRMGARPWAAHSRFDLGRTVAQSGEPGASGRSAELISVALDEYRDLGMAPWERKAERALDELGVRG